MRKFLFQVAAGLVAIYVSAILFEGFNYTGVLGLVESSALLAVLIVILRPLMMVLALPFNLLTFGALGLLINAWLIQLTDLILGNFRIASFWTALGAAVILLAIDWVLKRLFPGYSYDSIT